MSKVFMKEKILIFDFGSQYTQLIARRLRELNVYCEIAPYNKAKPDSEVKGVILSGSPCSVLGSNRLEVDLTPLINKYPVLGVCYGAQYLAHHYGGRVQRSEK